MLISTVEMIEQLSQGRITKNNNVMKPELDLSSPYSLSELPVLREAVLLCLLGHTAQSQVLSILPSFFPSTTLNEHITPCWTTQSRWSQSNTSMSQKEWSTPEIVVCFKLFTFQIILDLQKELLNSYKGLPYMLHPASPMFTSCITIAQIPELRD